MLSGLCEIIFLFFSVVDKNLVSRKGICVGLLNTLIVTIWYLLKYKAWKEDGNMEMGKEKKKKRKKILMLSFFFPQSFRLMWWDWKFGFFEQVCTTVRISFFLKVDKLVLVNGDSMKWYKNGESVDKLLREKNLLNTNLIFKIR